MAHLNLRIDAEILRSARIRARDRGTSVNESVRAFRATYAKPGRSESDAIAETRLSIVRIIESAEKCQGRQVGGWNRESTYAERTRRRK